MNLHNAEFVKSVVDPANFVRDGRPQIVFSGKSNVGKSSVINKVLNRKNFARVGASPGKTVHINYFLIDNTAYLVDLPGYGFAKVSKAERDRWGKLMDQYFQRTDLISFGVMIVDCRHKPTADDITMCQWFKQTGCPMIIVANKCDKVKPSQLAGNIDLIRQTLELDDTIEVIEFSAETGTNRQKLVGCIERAAKGGA